MHVAVKTLAAIEQAVKQDQGARFRGLLRKHMAALEDAYRDQEESFRSHLGASLMGRVCARELWYSFHWTTKSNFDGQRLRLFNRGHLEEGRMVALLELIGVTVWQFDEQGKQFRVSGSEGHYGGSGDGIGANIPDLPDPSEKAVLEFKTHNDKSFTELKKKGVKEAKFDHWAQMQQYMVKFRIGFSLYVAVNKNTDELYAEIVVCEIESGQKLIDRADKIIWLATAPPKVGNPPSPGNFMCRFCDHRPVCHLNAEPAKNCRTCTHSSPLPGGHGLWGCALYGNTIEGPMLIPKDFQPKGCVAWVKNPQLSA